MQFSRFGEKYTAESGIVTLMDDLGTALNLNPDMISMGGGNPSRIPAVERVFRDRLLQLLGSDADLHRLLGIYQSPQGDPQLLVQIAELLQRQFGWPVTAKNIAIANGSQSAFYILFNMFAGEFADGSHRHIQLPLAPEYLGYSDVGLSRDFFRATRPAIDILDDHLFKYRVDFDKLSVDHTTGAICVSRPTNPTGNVLTDAEVEQLDDLARQHGIPLIIDGAYGTPFPGIIFTEVKPHWNDNTVLVLSLSKLGLPGARTGIVVAEEALISAFTQANTIISLASGNLGPALARELFRSGEILSVSSDLVQPFYRTRSQQAVTALRRALDGLPYYIHKPEGAIFLWLWFKGLPITSQALYERLKARGVLIVAGHHFFVGMASSDWRHTEECIRVTYSQDPEVVERGIDILADEVRKAYKG
ncbi:valine--pyruvate transaminase [Exilibacterium tricleocarpae]|uniref:Valine--pyruvate transaminase n=1 Tax=Exilibacterium tricleocarpae TaxID=2591008 RepID=A0A545UA16_9GAMM|nr:valine--pyruvate transaminase [Exilibacterium tricleocarpae]TQV86316.1 valine--pyruvate transaminase [Exilibacterium tricleocarpae]